MLGYNTNVSTANTLMNEKMEFYLCTDVTVGEQLGIDYGALYWQSSSTSPVFFHKDSSEILQCAVDTCSYPGVYRCKKCKKTRYCSKACQRLHWPTHKVTCCQKCHHVSCSNALPLFWFGCRLKCTARYCCESCEIEAFENSHIDKCLSGIKCRQCQVRLAHDPQYQVEFVHEWYSCCKEMRFCGGHCYRARLKLNPLHQCDATLRQRTQYLTADF